MKNLLLLAALLQVGAVQAASLVENSAPVVGQAPPAADEDEDETPKNPATPATTTPAPTDVKKDAPAAAATTPKAALTPAAPATPTVTADEMKLVSGAPLYNPNVAVHIVEQKQFSDAGKREIVLYPLAAQANGKFTQHYGTMGSFIWHLHENFGLMLTGGYNWYNAESAFNGELVDKFRIEAQAATSLLQTWSALAGVEVTPIYGKFAFFEGTLAHFGLVLTGGAGAGGTRHMLKAETYQTDGVTISPATFGDTGMRFLGTIGAGFRVQVGQRFSIRVDVRDVIYTARVEKVNGCDSTDLKNMDVLDKQAKDPALAVVSKGCDAASYSGVDPATNFKRNRNIPLAKNLVSTPSSDVLNNVGVYLGASFLF